MQMQNHIIAMAAPMPGVKVAVLLAEVNSAFTAPSRVQRPIRASRRLDASSPSAALAPSVLLLAVAAAATRAGFGPMHAGGRSRAITLRG